MTWRWCLHFTFPPHVTIGLYRVETLGTMHFH
jgi:hypothetical protein